MATRIQHLVWQHYSYSRASIVQQVTYKRTRKHNTRERPHNTQAHTKDHKALHSHAKRRRKKKQKHKRKILSITKNKTKNVRILHAYIPAYSTCALTSTLSALALRSSPNRLALISLSLFLTRFTCAACAAFSWSSLVARAGHLRFTTPKTSAYHTAPALVHSRRSFIGEMTPTPHMLTTHLVPHSMPRIPTAPTTYLRAALNKLHPKERNSKRRYTLAQSYYCDTCATFA